MQVSQDQIPDLRDTSETLTDHVKITALSPRGGKGILIILFLVVSFHHVIIWGNIISVMIVPYLLFQYLEPLLALALGFLVITPMIQNSLSRTLDCPITRLENHLRWRLRKPKIRGFVGHYYVKPVRRFFKNAKTATPQTPEP